MPIFKLAKPMLALMLSAWPSAGQVVLAPVTQPPSSVTSAGARSVTLVPSTVALQITSPLTVFYGEAIDGLAQVTANDGSTVTGAVTFYDGTMSFCTLTLTNGASCPAAASTGFAAGTHLFTAVYSGDALHAAATSNAVGVTVKQDATSTTLVSSASQVAAGKNVVYSAQVQGAHGAVAGTVEFFDGASSMGSAALDGNGRASLSAMLVSPGGHTITAVYAGTVNSAGSTSAVLNEVVNGAAPGDGFTLELSQVTVNAGRVAVIPVKVTAGSSQAMTASCTGLPDEASCEYLAGSVRIATTGPRNCGAMTPYGSAGPLLAGLLVMFVPPKRKPLKGLVAVVCAVLVVGSVSGCGTGNCTDLGSRPGTYMVSVRLSGVGGCRR